MSAPHVKHNRTARKTAVNCSLLNSKRTAIGFIVAPRSDPIYATVPDAEREYAYDRDTSFGRLDKALDAAAMNHWVVVDMKNDWKRIFAFE